MKKFIKLHVKIFIYVVSEKKAFEHFPMDPMGKMFQNAYSLKPLG
jgi:hypothetical protein